MIVVDHIHTLIEPPFFADLPSVVKTEDSIIQMYEVSWSYQSHQRKIWRKDVQFFLDVLFNKILLTILSFECSSLRKPSLPHWKSWRKMCIPELKPRKAFPSDQALQNVTLLLPPLLQLFGLAIVQIALCRINPDWLSSRTFRALLPRLHSLVRILPLTAVVNLSSSEDAATLGKSQAWIVDRVLSSKTNKIWSSLYNPAVCISGPSTAIWHSESTGCW